MFDCEPLARRLPRGTFFHPPVRVWYHDRVLIVYWQPDIETMDRAALETYQLRQLNATLRQAHKSPFYRELLDLGRIGELRSFADLQDLPFTEKGNLRNNFPYGFLAVDLADCIRLHSSSGTTGNPTVVFHTAADVDDWADLVARCMYMCGVRRGDVFQNTMGYGLFTGGLGFHYGAERIGALTIPIGPGNSKRQIWFMQKFGTTAIHILPSYALHLFTYFRECEVDPRRDLKLKVAFVGAEPHSEEMRRQIEDLYGIKAYNSYGFSELCGPGVAFECPEQNGLHVWEDFCHVEIIDPETAQVLPEGEEGELVLTSLRREAMPLIRYRTRDLTRILPGPCPCGRTHRRIARFTGRSDDMLIINGVNLFPVQIEKTIMKVPGVGRNYVIEVHKEEYMDRLHIKIEVTPEMITGLVTELERLKKRIAGDLHAELGVTPKIDLVAPGSLPIAEGKARRVIDLRNMPRG